MIYALRATGFEAEGFSNGGEFFSALQATRPELVLLDVMLPGESGLSILKRLRASSATRKIPIIMVSAKGTEYDKVAGLDSGADDYLAKPFGVMELVSRVRAVLRRASPTSGSSELSAGPIHMNIEKYLVLAGGKELQLTPKEFSTLRYLMENPGVVITRDRLLEEVWGYDFAGETRTVDVHIRSLRQKLGEHADIIETVRGVGYRVGDAR